MSRSQLSAGPRAAGGLDFAAIAKDTGSSPGECQGLASAHWVTALNRLSDFAAARSKSVAIDERRVASSTARTCSQSQCHVVGSPHRHAQVVDSWHRHIRVRGSARDGAHPAAWRDRLYLRPLGVGPRPADEEMYNEDRLGPARFRATPKANHFYFNQSCDANDVEDDDDERTQTTSRDVAAGDELTVDYLYTTDRGRMSRVGADHRRAVTQRRARCRASGRPCAPPASPDRWPRTGQ
jgi:hypothetical protein